MENTLIDLHAELIADCARTSAAVHDPELHLHHYLAFSAFSASLRFNRLCEKILKALNIIGQ